jgi:hypothetical protein
MNYTNIKNLFLKILIACLVAAAGIAVVAVLAGTFTDVLGKALVTILVVTFHSLAALAFINRGASKDGLDFFTNSAFGLLVVSFATAVLGVWNVLDGEFVAKLYVQYFILLFAVLHGEILAKIIGKQAAIDKIVITNFWFMAVVVAMLVPVIFLADSMTLDGFYYRILAAAGIIDATLTLTAIIMHRLYLQKHPEAIDTTKDQPTKGHRGMSILVVILVGYIAMQMLGSLIFMIIGASR